MYFSYRKDSNVLLFPCTDTDIFIQIFQNLRKRPFFHNFALHSQINMNKSTVTISDVAKAAGVTRGTIDRVLHERGEVSEETSLTISCTKIHNILFFLHIYYRLNKLSYIWIIRSSSSSRYILRTSVFRNIS